MKITKLTFNMFGVNTYIVYDESTKECAIIDPGMMNNSENNIFNEFIEREQLKPIHLINTHLHIDHVLGNEYVSKTYGLTPYAHISDYFLGERIEQQASMFGLQLKVENIRNIIELSEDTKIKIGTEELKVIHVPGHSPGSVVLYSKNDDFIVCGDVLFQQSIGRTDLPGGDYSTLINGIRKKLLCLPDKTIVYPGHGPSTTIKFEQENNPYL